MTIACDLDGTLCSQREAGDYENAEPDRQAILTLRLLRARGHRIVIHTARGMGRAKGDARRAEELVGELTRLQLGAWGVPCDELRWGKPAADLVLDDRAAWWRRDWPAVLDLVEERT